MINKIAVEILGHINIVIVVLAGLLIVSLNKKIKLLGLVCYFLCNILTFLMFIFSGLYCFLSSTIIFVIVNSINLIRILRQK